MTKRMVAVLTAALLGVLPGLALAGEIPLYFPPDWKEKAAKAKEIAEAMAKSSGLEIKPRVVASNPDILAAFAKGEPAAVYVGSLVSTLIQSRGLGTPLAQGITGKEMYAPVLIAPQAAASAEAALKEAGDAVSYAKGATSGELGAKAATGGKANVAANNHEAALNAVKAGKAKAAFVKNWWWDGNKEKFAEFKRIDMPGISDTQNPDNVLSVSKGVSADDAAKIKKAAADNAAAFGVTSFKDVTPAVFDSTLGLIKRAGYDAATYTW